MSANPNNFSLSAEVRELIYNKIKRNLPKEDLEINYQIFIYDLMLKLIMYFQPFDIKLSSLSLLDSEIKAICPKLIKTTADNFLHNIQRNQIGEVINTVIKTRLFEQYQLLIEPGGSIL